MKKKIYYLYRLLKALVLSILYYVFFVFPIRRNRIVISCFEGEKGYICNPRAVVEGLYKKNGAQKYEYVWLTNSKDSFPNYIATKKNTVFNRAFYLSTSGIWLDNHHKSLEVRKLKNQCYINTWHGMIGFKAVGKFREDELPPIAKKSIEHDSSLIDYFLSNSSWVDNIYREAFGYKNTILRTGSPRCDRSIGVSDEGRKEQAKRMGFDINVKYLLYAPTVRIYDQSISRNFNGYDIPFSPRNICEALKKKTGDRWQILYRNHPMVKNVIKMESDEYIRDVTNTPDLYDILPFVDMVISDYSSCAFDAAITGKIVMLYIDDFENYSAKRGVLWNKDDLPFKAVCDEKDLIKAILEFDYEKYFKITKDFFDKYDAIEDGNATHKVIDLIDTIVEGGKPSVV